MGGNWIVATLWLILEYEVHNGRVSGNICPPVKRHPNDYIYLHYAHGRTT